MELLITKPEHSFVLQSRDASFHPGCPDKRNIRVNGDGFGVAWYQPNMIEDGSCLVKFATPAWCSSNLLNIAKFIESGLVFAHVRAASDGTVLTGNVNHENTHPFKFKRYTFMHNGGIPGFPQMKRALLSLLGEEAYEAIEGTTDSEVCFAFFLDELQDIDSQLTAREIAQALRRAITRLVSAVAKSYRPCASSARQRQASSGVAFTASSCSAAPTMNVNGGGGSGTECAGTAAASEENSEQARPEDGVFPPSLAAASVQEAMPAMSLNFCVTDGRHIVCSRYRNHPRQDPPSLFFMAGAGFACDAEGSCLRLTSAEPRTSVVISSEPLCRSMKSWKLVPRNSLVVVEGDAPTTASAAATMPNGDGGGGGDGNKGVIRQGLVSSITIEPLRCHPSDTPDPTDTGLIAEDSLPNFCARLVVTLPPSRVGGEPIISPENNVPLKVVPPEGWPEKTIPPLPLPLLREESVSVRGSSE